MSRELHRVGEEVRATKKAHRRVSAELRSHATLAAAKAMAEGISLREAGSALGVRASTLRSWLEGRPSKKRMARVTIQTEPETALSVSGPVGLRVDGMTLEQVATLWRMLT